MDDGSKPRPTTVRLAEKVRDRADRFAEETHRSLNGSVNYLVEFALDVIEKEKKSAARK